MGINPGIVGGSMAAGAGPSVRQTAPGVWAVGPTRVAVYRHDTRWGQPFWECQQCKVITAFPYSEACEHIKAALDTI